MESASQESLLTSAGFQARTPSTPEAESGILRRCLLISCIVARGKVNRLRLQGRESRRSLLGNKAQYAQFQQLAAKANLKEEKQVAHNMDNDLVYRWYGSWEDFGAASPVD